MNYHNVAANVTNANTAAKMANKQDLNLYQLPKKRINKTVDFGQIEQGKHLVWITPKTQILIPICSKAKTKQHIKNFCEFHKGFEFEICWEFYQNKHLKKLNKN